ncbi:hypothetical protein ABEB36_002749 [Hypothenemus hampei]|uniref:Major facilitator superfamily (MFS) profile domain-containing protein n=1 Tax=Hypothenemus hampei TaxID=57062 RepID=A0ABD1F6U0_HYPHA
MAEHVCTETPVVKTSKSLLCCRTLKKKRSEETKTKFTCKQKIALIMLALGDFMSVCSMSIITPFYPSVSAKKGVPSSLSGCIFAIYALIMFLFCPIFGKITPKLGAKPLFVIGAFAAGISNISFGLIDRFDSYNLFIISSFGIRIIEALGASAYSVATYVLIIDIFPQHIGFVRGLLETCIGLGLCAGPGLGGLLYGVGGFGLPFYVTGSVAIFVAFVNMHILPSPKEENIDEGGSFLDLLRLPPIFLTCIITTVVAMSNSFIDPTYEPHLSKTFGLTPTQVGLLFILDSATYGCSSPIFGWITDRTVNYSWLMTTGLFGTSAALLFLGPSPFLTFLKSSVWLNAVCLTGFGITTAMTIIPTYQYIIDTAE